MCITERKFQSRAQPYDGREDMLSGEERRTHSIPETKANLLEN
jgi:hypothetical protein